MTSHPQPQKSFLSLFCEERPLTPPRMNLCLNAEIVLLPGIWPQYGMLGTADVVVNSWETNLAILTLGSHPILSRKRAISAILVKLSRPKIVFVFVCFFVVIQPGQ